MPRIVGTPQNKQKRVTTVNEDLAAVKGRDMLITRERNYAAAQINGVCLNYWPRSLKSLHI